MPPAYVLALAVGFAACVTDLRSRRIPNILTFGSAVCAIGFHLALSGLPGGIDALGGWATGVALLFVPFALGGMGGGDVKLMGALGAWLGPSTVVWVVLYSGIAGGVFALAVSAYRGYLPIAARNIWLLLAHWRVAGLRPLDELTLRNSKSPKLAYAVPIFVGTLMTAWRNLS